MTFAGKIELGLIAVIAIGGWMMAPFLPGRMGVGYFLLFCSALLLLQSLVRDLWLLRQSKRNAALGPKKVVRAMCVESTVGIAGLGIGLILLGSGLSFWIPFSNWGWCLSVLFIMGFGFYVRDVVFEWNPWRFRRDKDHINIVFTWKK